MTESDPLTKSPKFGSNISNIFKIFTHGSGNLKNQLKSSQHIDKLITDFINNQHDIHKKSVFLDSLIKSIETMNLAAEELQFTLTPLVARYNDKSYENHFLPSIVGDNKDFDHVFVDPRFGVEDFYYHYHLYIPIPKDILNVSDPKTLVKEHWNLIYPDLCKFARFDLIKHFEPICAISRVYGWEGAWLEYSVAVIDKKDHWYWSLPLVKTTYNGCQPFLAVKEGEFAILQNDKTENCNNKTAEACNKIKSRVKQNENIEFEKKESIDVAPQWISAHAINSNGKPNSSYSYSKYSEDFSSKIGSGSFSESLNNSEKILDFMRKSTMGKPVYRFEDEDIGTNQIK